MRLAPHVGVALILAASLNAAAQQPRPVTPRGPLPAHEKQVVDLFQSAAPSVAYLTTESVQSRGFFSAEVSRGAGSGFVWDASGHVVTNAHVVEGARRVFVQLDAGQPIAAVPVGVSPEYDLAVVRLTRFPADLKPLPIGSSADLRIGQTVYAIGNPFGLSRTLTRGIVSALERELPTTDYREISGVIQTDAAINPGNSGGPLLDSAGRLVGVNSAIQSATGASAGVGFAIPVDLVNRIVPALIAHGRAPLPGIGIAAVRPDLAARAGIAGVVVAAVTPGSPAAKAGIQPLDRRSGVLGDVIVAVNGRRVDTLPTYVNELDRAGVGNEVTLTLQREGRERKVQVLVMDVNKP